MPSERYETKPFDEAIAYLSGKINLSTDTWRDIANDEHDAFFVVAGAKGAMLGDLRSAVDQAIAEGWSQEKFYRRFETITEGWAHRGGKDWRAQLVYRTNLRMSHAAGRYQYQLDPDVVKIQPYLQYIHGDSARPRPRHLALDGQVFRAEAMPFWPPSGYSCSCRAISLTDRQLQERGLAVSDIKRGDQVRVELPDGQVYNPVIEPDQGFDYIPGQSRQARRQEIINQVIGRSPEAIAQQIREDVRRFEAKRQFRRATAEQVQQQLPLWMTELRQVNPEDFGSKIAEKLYDSEFVVAEMAEAPLERLRGVVDRDGVVQSAASVFVERESLYIEYFGNAPWNLRFVEDPRMVRGAGEALMEMLIRESVERGFGGKLELTALSGSVPVYRERYGFVGSGRMTLSRESAQQFLNSRGIQFVEADDVYGPDDLFAVKDEEALRRLEAYKVMRRAETAARREQKAQPQRDSEAIDSEEGDG